MKIEQVSMRDYTSLRAGGECVMVRVASTEELLDVLEYIKINNKKIFILGQGTNSFFSNNIKELLVVKIEMKGIEIVPHQTVQDEGEEGVIIKAYAGETWDDVVKYTVERGWWGIENLSWVPGAVGAGPVQNIGAYGVEICDTLVSVEVLNRESNQIEILENKECEFSYRDSIFKKSNPVGDSTESDKYIILSINIKLSKQYKPTLTYAPLNILDKNKTYNVREIRNIIIETRKSKIPDYNLLPNAGSFFKNPLISKDLKESLVAKYTNIPIYKYEDKYKTSAAWLIEHIAKMKGVREGNVGTYEKQPLILVNYEKADAEEMDKFSQKIIDKVYKETGIKLEREVNYVK